jgi:DNA repair protein RadC
MNIQEKISRFKELQAEILFLQEDVFKAKSRHLKGQADVIDFIKSVSPVDKETVYCIFLDAKNKVIDFKKMSEGTLTKSVCYPREIIKESLSRAACSIILVHNHPSGNPEPSESDKSIARIMYLAGRSCDINLLDSVIIGSEKNYSFCETGFFRNLEYKYAEFITRD